MTDFRVVVAENIETFCKTVKENLDAGYRMVNSNMCTRSFSPQSELEAWANFGKGKLKDRTIREFYAYMEKEV